MIYKDIEFFGVAEMVERAGGMQFLRMPEKVRNCLNPRGKWNSQQSTNLEIRFVCDSPHVRLFISSLEGDADIIVYNGNYLHSVHYIKPGKRHCIHLEPAANREYMRYEDKNEVRRGFNSNVWRVQFSAIQAVFHELETYGAEVRPPFPEEVPGLTWLAYGSSITAGSGSARVDMSYASLTAHMMGVSLINMAMGGACYCEPELAEFIASRDDWDFAMFEIGVNMRESIPVEEFRGRGEFLIEQTLKHNPGKPVFIMTTYPNKEDIMTENTVSKQRQEGYNAILREIVDRSEGKLHLLEGHDMMNESDLTIDMIHPSASGHVKIAANLSRKISEVIFKS